MEVTGFFVSEFYNSADGSVTYVAVKPMSERSETFSTANLRLGTWKARYESNGLFYVWILQ
jgi:hypothetical protein